MTVYLYRIEHKGQILYAVKQEDRYYFFDLANPQKPLNLEDSAPEAECKLLIPTQPTKIVGVGLNYKDHALERNKPLPPEPLLFLKPTSALLAPEQEIVLPA